jgi:lipopolysaccharide transport system permease protein
MQNFSIAPREMAASLWRNRGLIQVLVKREVIGRYKGSYLGILWSLFNPVFMLLVYTFVFSVVFKARWAGGSDSRTEFALILFAGLLVFNLFSECVTRAPSLVLSNVNYVKKVVFPLEVLPVVSLGAALFHTAVSIAVWMIAYLILFGIPQPSALLLPAILLPLVLLILGLSWLLASLGVFLRDVAQFIGLLVTVLMFLSPIFYPVSALPPDFQQLFLLNPMTPVIEQVRNALIWNKPPAWGFYAVYLTACAFVAWLGFAWFQKTRKGFADVL